MSCNGCRVLRKGCSETCVLRPSLQWIESPEAQGHVTVFLAKFFGRAGLISSISAVPENQRPHLFQSLLFEAAGRTVNPVNGAVGLRLTGNWDVCQAAVDTVLRGGALKTELSGGASEGDECTGLFDRGSTKLQKRRRLLDDVTTTAKGTVSADDLDDLSCLTTTRAKKASGPPLPDEKRRLGSGGQSMNSEESVTTTNCGDHRRAGDNQIKLLNLFN